DGHQRPAAPPGPLERAGGRGLSPDQPQPGYPPPPARFALAGHCRPPAAGGDVPAAGATAGPATGQHTARLSAIGFDCPALPQRSAIPGRIARSVPRGTVRAGLRARPESHRPEAALPPPGRRTRSTPVPTPPE